MDNEQNNGDADAGIRHIERRPWMRQRYMQIEQKKINYVTVKQSVCQISEHACEQ